MDSDASTYHPVLANGFRDRGFDILFLWPKTPAKVMGGINSTLNPDIRAGQVKRWIRLLEPSPTTRNVEIYPAELTEFNIITCLAKPKEGSSAIKDTDILSPNTSYCCWKGPHASHTNPYVLAKRCLSFEQSRDNARKYPNSAAWGFSLDSYIISEEMKTSVQTRDGNRCFLTQKSPASVRWIFPPIWTQMLRTFVREEDYKVPGNAAMMCQEVAELMHKNAFGIDVDDGFRVIIFDPSFLPLKEKMPDDLTFLGQNESIVEFLRQHFRWCLSVYFIGESIEREFPALDVINLGEEMESKGAETLEDMKTSGGRWATPAGKEIWDRLLKTYCDGVGGKQWKEPGDSETPTSQ